jgi:hypothetical protein
MVSRFSRSANGPPAAGLYGSRKLLTIDFIEDPGAWDSSPAVPARLLHDRHKLPPPADIAVGRPRQALGLLLP